MVMSGRGNVAVRADVMTAVSVPMRMARPRAVTREMEMAPQAAESHRAEPHRPEDEAEGVWVHRIRKSTAFGERDEAED